MAIGKKRIIKHRYTIIELLVVLVIVGLLTGITMSGIKGALARQGAAGAVRTLAAKVSLAQSFAVSKNRYVALLIPDDDGFNGDLDGATTTNNPIPNNNTGNLDDYIFTQSRLCYVNKVPRVSTSGYDYVFERWVKGYEWQKLPSKTVAFIVAEGSSGSDPSQDSASVQVLEVDDPNNESSAIIFTPSGSLVNAQNVILRVYRADYKPLVSPSNFVWQGKEEANKGWKIGINGFTGRTKFSLGGANVFE